MKIWVYFYGSFPEFKVQAGKDVDKLERDKIFEIEDQDIKRWIQEKYHIQIRTMTEINLDD